MKNNHGNQKTELGIKIEAVGMPDSSLGTVAFWEMGRFSMLPPEAIVSSALQAGPEAPPETAAASAAAPVAQQQGQEKGKDGKEAALKSRGSGVNSYVGYRSGVVYYISVSIGLSRAPYMRDCIGGNAEKRAEDPTTNQPINQPRSNLFYWLQRAFHATLEKTKHCCTSNARVLLHLLNHSLPLLHWCTRNLKCFLLSQRTGHVVGVVLLNMGPEAREAARQVIRKRVMLPTSAGGLPTAQHGSVLGNAQMDYGESLRGLIPVNACGSGRKAILKTVMPSNRGRRGTTAKGVLGARNDRWTTAIFGTVPE